jgi:hypothetical protein
MEVMVAVQSGTLLHALRVQLKRSFRPQRRGLQRSPSGDPEEESPIPEQLRDPIFGGLFRMALKVETKQKTGFEFTFRFT